MDSPNLSSGDETEHDETCSICGEVGMLICCDQCPRVYHLACLSPPLNEAPKDSWICPICLKAKPCRECGARECDLFCTICLAPYHKKCMNLNDVSTEDFKCKDCSENYKEFSGVDAILTDSSLIPLYSTRRRKVKYPEVSYPELARLGPKVLVKWTGKSIIHAQWIEKKRIEAVAPDRLKSYMHYRKTCGPGKSGILFDSRWLKVEKIVGRSLGPSSSSRDSQGDMDTESGHSSPTQHSSQDGNRYLVKWQAFPYCDCTWETEETLRNLATVQRDILNGFTGNLTKGELEDELKRIETPNLLKGVAAGSESGNLRTNQAMEVDLSEDDLSNFMKMSESVLSERQTVAMNKLLVGRNSGLEAMVLTGPINSGRSFCVLEYARFLRQSGVPGCVLVVVLDHGRLRQWEQKLRSDVMNDKALFYGGSLESMAILKKYELGFSKGTRRSFESNLRQSDLNIFVTTKAVCEDDFSVVQKMAGPVGYSLVIVDESMRKSYYDAGHDEISEFDIDIPFSLYGMMIVITDISSPNIASERYESVVNTYEPFGTAMSDDEKESEIRTDMAGKSSLNGKWQPLTTAKTYSVKCEEEKTLLQFARFIPCVIDFREILESLHENEKEMRNEHGVSIKVLMCEPTELETAMAMSVKSAYRRFLFDLGLASPPNQGGKGFFEHKVSKKGAERVTEGLADEITNQFIDNETRLQAKQPEISYTTSGGAVLKMYRKFLLAVSQLRQLCSHPLLIINGPESNIMSIAEESIGGAAKLSRVDQYLRTASAAAPVTVFIVYRSPAVFYLLKAFLRMREEAIEVEHVVPPDSTALQDVEELFDALPSFSEIKKLTCVLLSEDQLVLAGVRLVETTNFKAIIHFDRSWSQTFIDTEMMMLKDVAYIWRRMKEKVSEKRIRGQQMPVVRVYLPTVEYSVEEAAMPYVDYHGYTMAKMNEDGDIEERGNDYVLKKRRTRRTSSVSFHNMLINLHGNLVKKEGNGAGSGKGIAFAHFTDSYVESTLFSFGLCQDAVRAIEVNLALYQPIETKYGTNISEEAIKDLLIEKMPQFLQKREQKVDEEGHACLKPSQLLSNMIFMKYLRKRLNDARRLMSSMKEELQSDVEEKVMALMFTSDERCGGYSAKVSSWYVSGMWSLQEDLALLALVLKHGYGHWAEIFDTCINCVLKVMHTAKGRHSSRTKQSVEFLSKLPCAELCYSAFALLNALYDTEYRGMPAYDGIGEILKLYASRSDSRGVRDTLVSQYKEKKTTMSLGIQSVFSARVEILRSCLEVGMQIHEIGSFELNTIARKHYGKVLGYS